MKDTLDKYFIAACFGDKYMGEKPQEVVKQYTETYISEYRRDLEPMYLEDEKDLHIVGVTNAYDQGQNQMREEVRKHFEEAGMDIVTAGHALSGAERCFSTYFGGYGPTEIVANTLRMFSQGVKVCVEVSTMALDAGKIPYQEKIVAIAGSGRGADTVVLLTPSYTKSILDTKVHKIIEMPE